MMMRLFHSRETRHSCPCFPSSLWMSLLVVVSFKNLPSVSSFQLQQQPQHNYNGFPTTSCGRIRQPQPSPSAQELVFQQHLPKQQTSLLFGPSKSRNNNNNFSPLTPLTAASAAAASGAAEMEKQQSLSSKIWKKICTKKFLMTLWIHVLSGFVVANYYDIRNSKECWPAAMMLLSQPVWNWVHGTCAMVFGGSIITTTLLEWNLFQPDNNNHDHPPFLLTVVLQRLLNIETILVLPALSGIVVSGVAQAFHGYGSLKYAPRHVKSALHALLVFGLWWGLMDRRSQHQLELSLKQQQQEEETTTTTTTTAIDRTTTSATIASRSSILAKRKVANVVSCLFLLALYAIMILKPGYNNNNL